MGGRLSSYSMVFAAVLGGFLLIPLFEVPVEAEPIEVPEVNWVRQFGTPRDDIGMAVAVDATGVYVTGVMDLDIDSSDAFVRKLDFDGEEVWTRVFGIDGGGAGYGIDTDGTGVVVAGMLEPEAFQYHTFVNKYDPDGNELWSNVSWGGGSEARGVTAHQAGTFLVGMSSGDVFLREVGVDGSEVWNRVFGTEGGEIPAGVGADETGVYVFGQTTGAFPGYTNLGRSDFFLAKFDHDGNSVWLRQFGTSSYDDSHALSVDAFGVYLVGESSDGENAVLHKYDKNGTEVWTRRFGDSFIELGAGVSAAGSSVFVVSTEDNRRGVLRRYDSEGNLVWLRKYQNENHTQPRFVINHDSGVYVTGQTTGEFPGEEHVGWGDAFLLRALIPAVDVAPAFVGFGDVEVRADATRRVTISSRGAFSLTVNEIALENGTRGFDVSEAPPLPLTLPPGDSADIIISFAPSVAGSAMDSVRLVMSNDSTNGVLFLPVEGNALAVAPTSPDRVAVTAGGGRMILTWESPWSDGGLPITGYRVYRGTSSGMFSLLHELGPIHTFEDSDVVNGQPYHYQVSAMNAVGEGPRSQEVSGTPTATPDTTKPAVAIVSPASGATVTSAILTVAGTASDNVAVHRVELSTDGTNWVVAAGTTSWSGTLTLREGANTIHVRVTDTSGNNQTETMTVTLRTSVEQAGLQPTVLIAAALVIVAAVASVAVALSRRKAGRKGRT